MNVAISNLAWQPSEDAQVSEALKMLGIKYLELAPTKIWPDLTLVTPSDARLYRKQWENRGIHIVAMQSLLYGHPELTLFENQSARSKLKRYMQHATRLAVELGVNTLVFGSPLNRRVENLSQHDALEIGSTFFSELATDAETVGVTIAIEPNSVQYGCNFITTAQEGIHFVKIVNKLGFKLQLDAGTMSLLGESPSTIINEAKDCLLHVHASEPFLKPFNSVNPVHKKLASALETIQYNSFVSLEMLSLSGETKMFSLSDLIKQFQEVYT